MKSLSLFAGAVTVALTTMAIADGHEEVNPAVKARPKRICSFTPTTLVFSAAWLRVKLTMTQMQQRRRLAT